MAGDPVPFFGRANSDGVVRCDCAMCRGNYACGGQLEPPRVQYAGQVRVHQRSDGERVVHPLWAQAVPNRLYGATINHEGDAV